jgi:hypothetical protein
MEAEDTEQKFLELLRLRVAVEELNLVNRGNTKRVSNIGSQSLWRLISHFDTILQD